MNAPATIDRIYRGRLGRGDGCQSQERFLPLAGGRKAHALAGLTRQDHQHRLAAFVSGRHSRVLVHRCEERSCGADEAPRLRMGDQGDRNAAILARIPAGHWGKPEEIGGAAVFLASAAADYVHGVVLPVDGGWLAR